MCHKTRCGEKGINISWGEITNKHKVTLGVHHMHRVPSIPYGRVAKERSNSNQPEKHIDINFREHLRPPPGLLRTSLWRMETWVRDGEANASPALLP